MKKRIALLSIAAVLFLCGIAAAVYQEMDKDYAFKETKDGRIISREDGTEYALLDYEGNIVCLGEEEHIGSIINEEKYYNHFGLMLFPTGMIKLSHDETKDILIRRYPYSEWRDIYRKASLPELDISFDNISRIEWITCGSRYHCDASHAFCGYGLTGEKMQNFFEAVYNSQTEEEAGLSNSIRNSKGFLENCYVAAYVFCFFEDEPNIARPLEVLSYNNIAYTIDLPCDGHYKEYVIPDEWLKELIKNAHVFKSEGGSTQIIYSGGFDS